MSKVQNVQNNFEIDFFPKDWNIARLSDVADKKDRYSFTGGPFGSDLKSEHYTDTGVRIIQLQNIGDGEFLNNYAIYTSEKKADDLISCNIFPNEIIMAKMDPVARACLVPNLNNRYLMCSDGIRLNVDKERYNNHFILYFINSRYFRNKADLKGIGTTRKRIGLSTLRELTIVVPAKLEEQDKIAEILTTINNNIQKTSALIEKYKNIKTGMMADLFTRGVTHDGKLRPPYEQAPELYHETELGFIPKGWFIKSIGSLLITQPQYGANESAEDYNSHNPRYLRITDITDDGYLMNEEIKSLSWNKTNGYILEEDDIVIARTGNTVGKSYIYKKDDCPMAFAGYLIKFKFNKDVCNPLYIFYYLHSYLFYNWIDKTLKVGAKPNINAQEYSSFHIYLPELSEQLEIINIISSIDKKIETEQKYLEKLKQLKQGLMQDLLTGKVRVKQAEPSVA